MKKQKKHDDTLESMFWRGDWENFVNAIQSGLYEHKNIKDPAKIARRFAAYFNRYTAIRVYFNNGKFERQKELIEVAEAIEAERKAEKEAKKISKSIESGKATSGIAKRRSL